MNDHDYKVPGFFLVLFPDHALNHIRAVLPDGQSFEQLHLSDHGRSTSEIAEVYGFSGTLLNQFLEAHLIQQWICTSWQPSGGYQLFANGHQYQDVVWNVAGQLLIHGMLQNIGLIPLN